MVRMIAMDLDGTLLTDDKRITAKNLEAIRGAREKGVRIVPCSGRSPKSIHRIVQELDLDQPGEYYIVSNGACILEGGTGKVIASKLLPGGAASRLVNIARENSRIVNAHIYIGNQFLVERYLPCTAVYETLSGSQCTVVPSLDPYLNQPMLKLLYNSGSPADLAALQEKMKGCLPEKVQMFRSSEHLLEFVHQDAGKWNAVAYLLKYLNILPNEVMCIGDNENDEGMIQRAGIGAAPCNAVPIVRENADYVAISDNNHDAVSEIIQYFVM